mgnify:CR=1 FL=1
MAWWLGVFMDLNEGIAIANCKKPFYLLWIFLVMELCPL